MQGCASVLQVLELDILQSGKNMADTDNNRAKAKHC
jgi:hypothetical protein